MASSAGLLITTTEMTAATATSVFSPERAGDLDASYELRLQAGRFRVVIAGGDAEIAPGDMPDADVVITASAENLFAVVRGVRTLAEAEASGDLEVSGDRTKAERFFDLFPLPEPALAAG